MRTTFLLLCEQAEFAIFDADGGMFERLCGEDPRGQHHGEVGVHRRAASWGYVCALVWVLVWSCSTFLFCIWCGAVRFFRPLRCECQEQVPSDEIKCFDFWCDVDVRMYPPITLQNSGDSSHPSLQPYLLSAH